MNKAISFVRLDFLTVKPYLTVKNLCLFVLVALIMLVVNNSAGAAIAMLMAFAALYASYPFAIGDKSNIDVLYTTLSIKRSTVVLGRYLFALILDVIAGVFAIIFSFIVLTAMHKGFDSIQALFTTLVLFILFSIITAVQLPIYFKIGYTKAKFLAYLPFIVFPLVFVVFSNFFSASIGFFSLRWIADMLEWFAANPPATALIVGAVWFGIMFVSYKASVSVYQKRDF